MTRTKDTDGSHPKRRIAILGGGPAALAAAHELTRVPHWEDRYEVTIYQMGWRLGGKCASGRGVNARIEEHGLHIFQGWYNNAFWMVQKVYEERAQKKLAPHSPFQRWDDGFIREDAMIMVEFLRESAELHHWAMVFPENGQTPGGEPAPTWTVIGNAVAVVISAAIGVLVGENIGPFDVLLGRALTALNYALRVDAPKGLAEKISQGLIGKLIDSLASGDLDPGGLTDELLDLLRGLLHVLEKVATFAHWDNARCALALVEVGVVALIGILVDVWDPATKKFDYDAINNLDFREWLRSHGASDEAVEAGLVRFLYNATFSNLAGTSDGGSFAAGTALRAMVQMLGYKGALVWQLRAGVGDVVVGPLYQVLKSRGVKFEFFQRVDAVHWSDTGSIERVTMDRQVKLAGPDYDPLMPLYFEGRTLDAWPDAPRYEQLDPEQAARLRAGKVDLESPWADWPKDCWEMKRGEHFDDLMLCVPVAALRDVCPELIERDERWRNMVDNVPTASTVAMQLWLKPTLLELGMDLREWGLNDRNMASNCEVYVDPLSSWTDCSRVLDFEQWPVDNRPRTLVYYCGALAVDGPMPPYTDHGFPERAREEVRIVARQWLNDNMGYFWPKGTCLRRPRGLDLSLLVAPGGGQLNAVEKFRGQYFRANVSPTERYTLCVPGDQQYRLTVHGSGFDNLFLAGDWVRHKGINAGFFEGAVIAGREAAQRWLHDHFPTVSHHLTPLFVEHDVVSHAHAEIRP